VVVAKGRRILPQDLPIFRPEYRLPPANKSLQEMERAHLLTVLKENEWNILKSARILGIDRSTLYNKIRRHHISKPS
jgi:transcriptional regulator of acetoin/glycerol metabolism